MFWRLLPVGLVLLVGLWGLIHPRSQWRLLYGRLRRYQHVGGNEDEQDSLVRLYSSSTVFLSLLMGCVLGFLVDASNR